MNANRTNSFETFRNFVQFYPRLTATIAFGAMAAAGRMIPRVSSQAADAPLKVLKAVTPALPTKAIKRAAPRKAIKHVARKATKRTTSRRRKAA